MRKILFFMTVVLFVGLVTKSAMAQCGAEGLDRCCGDPARTCQAGGKLNAVSAKMNLASSTVIKQRTDLIRLQRQQAESMRLRQKQLAKISNSETANFIKNLLAADRSAQNLNLFPVEDFTPGVKQTTYFSLLLDTQECSRIDENGDYTKCYIINGYHLYFDKNNVSDHIYTTRLRIGGMPETWSQYGFDWDLSYNGWNKLFKNLGYQTFTTQKPGVKSRDGEKFFDAELMTIVKTPQGRMQLTLDFTNGFGKTGANDTGTLFSMIIDRL